MLYARWAASERKPPPPPLQGNVSILAYRDASYALRAGTVVALPGVVGGASISGTTDFYFRTAPNQYSHYQPDSTAAVHPPFPADNGFTATHGPGPRLRPWTSHNPRDRSKPFLLGELVDGVWDLDVLTGLSPRAPSGYAASGAGHRGAAIPQV